ncbi:DNA translocase FtsK [Lactiplantibacillus carotarum]|uniref:DNA translocase FtsK n=1 Tax=Lactiplantibacillus carotarum TaxID=2993456 RepID=UPI00298F0D97|nr:DNA translocase FtsK [Lactiplantibacillus carotarum]
MNHYDGPAFFRKYRLTTPQVNTSAAASQSTPATSSASSSASRPASTAATSTAPVNTSSPRRATTPVRSQAAAVTEPARPTSNAPFSGGTHGSFHPSRVPAQLNSALTNGGIIQQKDDRNYLEIEACLHKQPASFFLFGEASANEPLTTTNPASTAATVVIEPHSAGFSDQPTEVFEPTSVAAPQRQLPSSGPTQVFRPATVVSSATSAATPSAATPVASTARPTEVLMPTTSPTSVTTTATPVATVEAQGVTPTSAASESVDPTTSAPSTAPTEVFEPTAIAESAVTSTASTAPTEVFEPTQPISAATPATSTGSQATSTATSAAKPVHGLGLSLGDIMTAEHDAQADLALFKDKASTDHPAQSEATNANVSADATVPQPTDRESSGASTAPVQAPHDASDDEPYQPVGMHAATRPVSTSSMAATQSSAPATSTVASTARVATSAADEPQPNSAVHTGESAAPVLADKELAAYHFPPLNLLKAPVVPNESEMDDWIEEKATALEESLDAFGVDASVVDWTIGPTITQFQVKLARGVKVSKITNLDDDLKLALAVKQLRIEAPIPGRNTVGIEIPNMKSRPVMLSEVLDSKKFSESKSPLTVALGVDLFGQPQVTDLRKMPHGLIAGSTGSGKSVFINSILVSLLYKANPQEVKLLLVDPKAVELAPYNEIPHLLAPVISEPKAASAALKWVVDEMDNRYDRLAAGGARNIEQFNRLAEEHDEPGLKMPYIVIVIDELADLMMVASSEVQDYIARITAKARAAGIHLLVATQRPSVDVVTGVIKNNIPTRIAFMTSSQVDSRTILDASGAEQLLGRGDMLYLGNGQSNPMRLQGTFVDSEIDDVTQFVRDQAAPHYEFQPDKLMKHEESVKNADDLMPEVLAYLSNEDTMSVSKMQRNFSIGYNRAANIIDDLENRGYVSAAKGSKARDVFFTADDLTKLQANS